MPRYIRRNNDVEYRRVLLTRDETPAYIKFNTENQAVDYTADSVLEVRCSDGSEHLIYDNGGKNQTVECSRRETNGFRINVRPEHAARLYVRDENGMEYKIPSNLPPYRNNTGDVSNTCFFLVSELTGELTIVGDKYFSKVYDVNMI